MTDKSYWATWFTNLAMGERYSYIGVAMLLLTFFGGAKLEEWLSIRPEMVRYAFLSGWGLIGIGTVLHVWRFIKESSDSDRRTQERPKMPPSRISEEFAKQLTTAIELAQADDLPLLEHDAKKTKPQLQAAVKRLRLREAARHGETVYYSDGLYVPRSANTVFQP